MPDYSKSKIYKLVSNYTNEIYIGSTCQPLHKRKGGHKASYKSYLEGKRNYMTSFKLFEKGEVDIILIEECNFHNKDELHKKEREYIDKLECVNKYIPGRTKQEYLENNKNKMKQYYETHKDEIKQYQKKYNKEYHQKNKEKMKQYYKEYYQKKKLESLNLASDNV